MENKKWYIKANSAEEDAYAVVELTEQEAEIIRKFLSVQPITGSGYCGSCFISNKSYTTEEEAKAAIYEGKFWEED